MREKKGWKVKYNRRTMIMSEQKRDDVDLIKINLLLIRWNALHNATIDFLSWFEDTNQSYFDDQVVLVFCLKSVVFWRKQIDKQTKWTNK